MKNFHRKSFHLIVQNWHFHINTWKIHLCNIEQKVKGLKRLKCGGGGGGGLNDFVHWSSMFLILFRFEMLVYMPYLLYFYRSMLSFSTMLTVASTIWWILEVRMGHSLMNIEYLRYGIKVTKSVINIRRFMDVSKIITFEYLYKLNGVGHSVNNYTIWWEI